MSCGVRQTYGTLGFCFQVQSSKFPVREITDAILTYVSGIPGRVIARLEAAQYANQVGALRGNRLVPPPSLTEAARAHWSEIEDGHYCFFAPKKQAALLEDDKLCGQVAMEAFSHALFLGAPKILVVQATRATLNETEVQKVDLSCLQSDQVISTACDTSDAFEVHELFPVEV